MCSQVCRVADPHGALCMRRHRRCRSGSWAQRTQCPAPGCRRCAARGLTALSVKAAARTAPTATVYQQMPACLLLVHRTLNLPASKLCTAGVLPPGARRPNAAGACGGAGGCDAGGTRLYLSPTDGPVSAICWAKDGCPVSDQEAMRHIWSQVVLLVAVPTQPHECAGVSLARWRTRWCTSASRWRTRSDPLRRRAPMRSSPWSSTRR
jgi:hypothetical protein